MGLAHSFIMKKDLTMKKEDIEKKTEALVLPILDRLQFSLYDVEYVKEGSDFYLRVYIDKEGGIAVDDCETVSREMNTLLDREDYIRDAYIFEVSSPGLTRALTKDRHFEKSIGKAVELKLYAAVDKQKEWSGVLTAFDRDTVTITLENGEEKRFTRKDIASIRLEFQV